MVDAGAKALSFGAGDSMGFLAICSQGNHEKICLYHECTSGRLWLVKPVSHQPCGSRAPVRVDKFLDFVRQPHGVVYYTAKLPYEKQGRKAAATNFRHVHFLCDLFAFSERCTTAARHTRLPQDCCKTPKVFVRLKL